MNKKVEMVCMLASPEETEGVVRMNEKRVVRGVW